MPMLAGLHREVIRLKAELAKFGVVGGIGAIIDLGGAAYLHDASHLGEMTAKAISISAATVVTYLGSRFWTFRHRVNQDQTIGRETAMFFALNVVGLAIAEIVIGVTSYGLGMKGHLAYDAASVLGTGLGTIFRYFAYKKWVFTAAPAPATATVAPAPARAGGGRHAARHAAPSRPGALPAYSVGAAQPQRWGPVQEQLDPATDPF
jgi:putative flippase GtrA